MKRVVRTAAITAGLVLASCGQETRPDTAAPAPPPRTLTIGIKFDQPGLSTRGPDGKPRGFDVDTAVYIAGKLGVQPEHITWREARSDQRENLLNSGTVDFVVASYSITAGRQQLVSFAGPYLLAGQDLLVRQSERGITRPEDLNGRTVCTAEGSTSAEKIRRSFARSVELSTRDTYDRCVADLIAGTVDAVSTDDVILAGFAAEHVGTLKLVGHRFTRERYGVGIRKGDIDLQARITSAIRMMIADGSWRRAMETHLSATGYRPFAAPLVFNAPDRALTPADPTTLDPDLLRTTRAIAATSNARDWEGFRTLVCPETADAIDEIVTHYTPQYDKSLATEVKNAGFTNTITGVTQTDPNAATFVFHEAFTNVPEKYKQYFKDIDYTGTMVRRNGEWKLCALDADFVEP
ncbi:glutamate ABC transporter substrate-binding protein [Nocardia huaxiensis]|uniref:Glutamate ABC transporter substrate-binding protein n=1 Tax=Nocardia huaxiensis TaxID=2755382 RepID=A0A7D6Z3L9_9NOCA|nr:glutamate ABC transporter substrate-binding protein [Nocardia huaxiensis]QLY30224.1 glutamate ABC transporter substrate-binding protein [Nocardia huaxiensis]UFS96157.1 glutamate ABC transporter substrate-binding protein [Nocardia huaxiensis]